MSQSANSSKCMHLKYEGIEIPIFMSQDTIGYEQSTNIPMSKEMFNYLHKVHIIHVKYL
jgi:hypothetical protein